MRPRLQKGGGTGHSDQHAHLVVPHRDDGVEGVPVAGDLPILRRGEGPGRIGYRSGVDGKQDLLLAVHQEDGFVFIQKQVVQDIRQDVRIQVQHQAPAAADGAIDGQDVLFRQGAAASVGGIAALGDPGDILSGAPGLIFGQPFPVAGGGQMEDVLLGGGQKASAVIIHININGIIHPPRVADGPQPGHDHFDVAGIRVADGLTAQQAVHGLHHVVVIHGQIEGIALLVDIVHVVLQGLGRAEHRLLCLLCLHHIGHPQDHQRKSQQRHKKAQQLRMQRPHENLKGGGARPMHSLHCQAPV